jgi:hypothetical protein
MRFAPLQRVPARSSSIMDGLASPDRLRPQVFTTSRRFVIHREPAGLVSCRIRSWGCTLQSFAPTAWPYAVSDADPLVVLVPARHHLYVPLPLAPAKAEASSRPDSRCPSVEAEASPVETAAARPAGTEVPPSRTVARPSKRRSALRAEPWLYSPRPRSLRAERSPDPPVPKRPRGCRSTLVGTRSTLAPSRARPPRARRLRLGLPAAPPSGAEAPLCEAPVGTRLSAIPKDLGRFEPNARSILRSRSSIG